MAVALLQNQDGEDFDRLCVWLELYHIANNNNNKNN